MQKRIYVCYQEINTALRLICPSTGTLLYSIDAWAWSFGQCSLKVATVLDIFAYAIDRLVITADSYSYNI